MQKILLNLSFMLRSIYIDPNTVEDPDMSNDTRTLMNPLNDFIVRYKGFIMGVLGIATLTMFIVFGIHFSRLAASAHSPMERKKVISGIIWTAVACGVLGSITVFFALIYSSLK